MSMPMKRERGDDDATASMAVTLPRKLQRVLSDALSPVSPTVAAGVLPRSSVYAAPHPQAVDEVPPHAEATATATASTADPIQALEAIRARLALSTDPHLQAKLLLQFSHVAISPGAPTNSAIDFLFSFLQQSQSAAASSSAAQDMKSERDAEPAAVSRATGGPIVVGAIVRGLRKLLAVKAKVVEPMIQVDAMGEQLMQCVSVAEDFKLRQDMMQIVVDCLMITRAHAQVETLLGTCVRDHDPAMQAICLQGYLRLYDAGYHFTAAPAKLFDLATMLLLHGGTGESQKQERVQLRAVRLVTALSQLHPLLDVTSKYFAQGSTLRDTAFYVLCMSASGVSVEVRKEIALSLRTFKDASTHVVEHALQKTQISEELLEDSALKTVLMLSSGALLDLLEDRADEVSAETSRTIGYLAKATKWSEQILDRAISAHVDLLPAASKSKSRFLALVRTLEQLLIQRKEHYGAEFSLTSEEVNYILRDEAIQADASAILSILSALIHCDTCSVWMVQRVVEYALLAAECVVNSAVVTGVQSKQHLLRLTKEIQLKCGATIQMDTALVDELSREATQHQQQLSSVKAEVCSLLLGKSGRASVSSGNGSESRSISVQSEISPRPGSSKELTGSSERKESLDYAKLLKSPSVEQDFTAGLKSILRLRKTADVKSEASGLRVVELLLQLKQHVKALPDTAAPPPPPLKSSYVSMDAMLGSSRSSSDSKRVKKLNEYSRLVLPVALARGCEEIVRLASDLYIKESGLSSSARADVLQLTLLARVGLVISQLQTGKKSDSEIATSLQWLVNQGSQLRFLLNDNATTMWFSTQLLTDISSLNELKRDFVDAVRKAWPHALLQALSVLQSQPSRCTSAVIYEPEASNKEPREIVAQWPFTVRVKSVVENLSDLTRVFIKSVLPNGETSYHHVPVHAISFEANPSSYLIDHSIKLTISPFSDPTSYSVALCMQHPALPGALEMTKSESNPQAQVTFTEISDSVSERIFHRTNSTIRRG